MDEVKLIEVIYCSKKRAGTGKSELDPVRIVEEVFTKDGELLMDKDDFRKYTLNDMVKFSKYCLNNNVKADELNDPVNCIEVSRENW